MQPPFHGTMLNYEEVIKYVLNVTYLTLNLMINGDKQFNIVQGGGGRKQEINI